MFTQEIESLFLDQKSLSSQNEQLYAERLSNLNNDPALKELHKIKKTECIVKALQALELRQFEEAYAEVKTLSAIMDYEESFAAGEHRLKELLSKQEKSNPDILKH